MAGAQGVGGVFLDSADPAALAAWYNEHLDVGFVQHPDGASFYRVFHTRDFETSEVRENPVLAINLAPGVLARATSVATSSASEWMTWMPS